MQEYMGKVSRGMETPGKNQKRMQEIKTIVTKIKDALEGLINKLGTAEKTISELEDRSL